MSNSYFQSCNENVENNAWDFNGQQPENHSSTTENTRILDDSTVNQTESVVALSYHDFKIGATYYSLGSSRIELLHEMYEFDDFTVLQKILCKFIPTNVVISSVCSAKMFHFLKKFSTDFHSNVLFEQQSSVNVDSECSSTTDKNYLNNPIIEKTTTINEEFTYSFMLDESTLDNMIMNRFKLHTVPSRCFSYEQCKSRILSINFPRISHINDKTERFIYLSSYINFFETNTIQSLGILLHFIEKEFIAQKPISGCQLNSLSNFVYVDLGYFVSIDQITFEALDIFQNEWHPSITKKGFTKKESFTLYGIFNSCASSVGSNYLRKLFLQPLTDFIVLEDRFTTIQFFADPNNENLKKTIYQFLRNIKDLSTTINRLKSMCFTLNDFQLLHQISLSVISIRNLISNNIISNTASNLKINIFETIAKYFTIELDEIYECLEKTIDWKRSKENGKIMLKKDIDDQLDRLKFYFNKMPEILQTALAEDDTLKELIEKHGLNITIIYLPQLGFLLKLLLVETQRADNIIENFGLELIFCANDCVYYKNQKTKEFDEIFGDLLSEIEDRIQQNLIQIKDFILKRIEVLLLAINYCAFLDSMIAMAQTAIDYGLVKPKITCSGIIKIEQGRHPLYEMITNSFIPNDYFSDNHLNNALIVFGLNGSGKTVYLKQVSLIVYLAHIGSYVPAKYAEISLVDKMFTRIRTPESISTQMSSFKHNLNQMIDATKYAKRRSLVVIDMFGNSTLHSDGFALLEACLHYWLNNGDQTPHLIISTQYCKITRYIRVPKVRCYLFGTVNGVRNYKLKPYETNDVDTNNGIVPELLQIDKLVNNELNKKELIEKLQNKQNTYLKLADMILNTTTDSTDSLEQIKQFIKNIIH